MNIIRTGRVMGVILPFLHALRGTPGVKLDALPLNLRPYRPPGIWATCQPREGRPLLFRLPPPAHPLEAIAAMRGMTPLEPPEFESVAPAGERMLTPANRDLLFQAAALRQKSWVDTTAKMAEYLLVPPPTVRLLFHMLTPLRVSPFGADAWDETVALFEALGFSEDDALQAHSFPDLRGPLREKFWTHEVTGDIEL